MSAPPSPDGRTQRTPCSSGAAWPAGWRTTTPPHPDAPTGSRSAAPTDPRSGCGSCCAPTHHGAPAARRCGARGGLHTRRQGDVLTCGRAQPKHVPRLMTPSPRPTGARYSGAPSTPDVTDRCREVPRRPQHLRVAAQMRKLAAQQPRGAAVKPPAPTAPPRRSARPAQTGARDRASLPRHNLPAVLGGDVLQQFAGRPGHPPTQNPRPILGHHPREAPASTPLPGAAKPALGHSAHPTKRHRQTVRSQLVTCPDSPDG